MLFYRSYISFFFSVVSMLILACQGSAPVERITAVYHWKSHFRLDSATLSILHSRSCRTLYVKCLDIGKNPVNGALEPLSRTVFELPIAAALDIIPCVFLKNDVFEGITPAQSESLAERIVTYLFQSKDPGIKEWLAGTQEIQLDCDWTQRTKLAYFRFLEQVKAQLPEGIKCTATIRLHQYKFPEKNGLPPVDRGMLMLYNTGDVEDMGGGNSIFSQKDVEKYLNPRKQYPLALDVALPLFQWGLVYRDGELWKIIDDFPEAELKDTTRFSLIAEDPAAGISRWAVRSNTFVEGYFLRPEDQLRIEYVSREMLQQLEGIVHVLPLSGRFRVAYFDLDAF